MEFMTKKKLDSYGLWYWLKNTFMNQNEFVKLLASFKGEIFRTSKRSLMDKAVTTGKVSIKSRGQNWAWFSIVSIIVVLSIITMWTYFNYNNQCQNQDQNQSQSLGTYDDPEVAFRETQKALLILSTHLNSGMESVQYIQEYDKSKNLIFKEQ